MKPIKRAVAFLLTGSITVSAVLAAMTQGGILQEPENAKVVVISDRVGETIDLKERNYYHLFPLTKNFQSAVFLRQPDSTLVLQISEKTDGIEKLRTQRVDWKIVSMFRQYIDHFENLSPVDKRGFFYSEDEERRAIVLKAIIRGARQRANMGAKEKWSKERWRAERSNDRGWSYRSAYGMFGFTLGSAAGMIIGKGFQGKKVERQEYHPGGWFGGPWTENFYSHEHKYAPYWGAALGGISGVLAGCYLGKKADKEYYLLVPPDIRMEPAKSSWIGNILFGGCVTGTIMGGISGLTLYAPESHTADVTAFGPGEFLGGYIVGATVGTVMIAAFKSRAKHQQLWEDSQQQQTPESSMDIQLVPLDPTAFSIHTRKLPNGEIFYEYRMDLLRIRF